MWLECVVQGRKSQGRRRKGSTQRAEPSTDRENLPCVRGGPTRRPGRDLPLLPVQEGMNEGLTGDPEACTDKNTFMAFHAWSDGFHFLCK